MEVTDKRKQTTDRELIDMILLGESSLYDELFSRYRSALMSMLQQKCRSTDDAEDILQETFVKTYLNLERYNSEFEFGQWIFTIARNLSIDFARKRHEAHISLDQPYGINPACSTPTPEEHIIRKQNDSQLNAILQQLPEHYRTIIELRFWCEYSYEEIAERLNLPLGTVKTQIHRARERFCAMITDRKLI